MRKLAATHVSFIGDYNEDHSPTNPAGKEIIDYLAVEIEKNEM